MPYTSLLNVGSKYLLSTSNATRGPYVPILHNISRPTPPAVGSSGLVGYGPIDPVSQPLAFSWVTTQQPILV